MSGRSVAVVRPLDHNCRSLDAAPALDYPYEFKWRCPECGRRWKGTQYPNLPGCAASTSGPRRSWLRAQRKRTEAAVRAVAGEVTG